MAGQPKQTTRSRKIEPLNWAETANSPALKGMMSFLDIKPEEVRSGHFKDVPSETSCLAVAPVELDSTPPAVTERVKRTAQPKSVIEIRPGQPKVTQELRSALDVVYANETRDSETRTGTESLTAAPYIPGSETHTGSVTRIAPPQEPASETRTGSVSDPVRESPAVSESPIGGVSLPGPDLAVSAYPPTQAGVLLGAVPSQNRKIRKCRLSQDAHSAGEEMLYRILWEEGRQETSNPLGSRIVRIGYAELSNKARMHKANVRLNLASLTAKLAIEQSGDFDSRSMIAKAYRVLSYKEILERRRAAGLEYVIRQKNVVFVTETGVPILLEGMPQKPKANTRRPISDSLPVSDSRPDSVLLPVRESHAGSDTRTGTDSDADLAIVSKALNTFWPVDDAASSQLLRACRTVRPDAEADEIAFFVLEKLDVAKANRSITNPTGLILATVPQSFQGHSFETFRARRKESLRLAREEAARKAEEERNLEEWMIRDARKTLGDPNATPKQRKHAEEILAMYEVPGN